MYKTLEEPIKDIWYVLRRIKGELNSRVDKRNLITYTILLHPKDPNTPNPTVEQGIIIQLKDLRFVEEVKEHDEFEVFSEEANALEKRSRRKSVGVSFHLKVNPTFDKLYNEYDKKIQEYSNKSPLNKLGRFCRFENNSLILELPDGSSAPIDFHSKRGNKDMLDVFEATFDYWQESAELKNGWLEATITKAELKKKLINKGKKDISDNWLKNTISNIRNTKIKQSKLSNLVAFGYFNRRDNGWLFRIKQL